MNDFDPWYDVEMIEVDFKSNKSASVQLRKAYQEIKELIENRHNEKFKLVSITPVTAGVQETSTDTNESYGLGYGYTCGFILVFQNVEDQR